MGIAWLKQVCNTGATFSAQAGEYTSGTAVSSISKFFMQVFVCGTKKKK